MNHIKEVSIEVGNNIYARLESISNTPAHVLAEFIDNAMQSYLDHKEELLALDPQYKLKIDINFNWRERTELSSVTIQDNAAGISQDKFVSAFTLAHTPDSINGLNEFGMGMKTAALWLGRAWQLTSTSLGEEVERTVCFDLDEVIDCKRQTLPVSETAIESKNHRTEIVIKNLTKNAPTLDILDRVNRDLASIYRQQLRNNVICITINGQVLHFDEYPILDAPYAGTPGGQSIRWKKEIDFSFDNRYKVKGFIAILREMKANQNGLVLMRRGRVILGAEEGKRYYPKTLFGNTGSPRYKRLFGELELEGFSVSFNKDDIQEKEELEALMGALRSEIHTKDFDLYSQAENYRPDNTQKKIDSVVRSHNPTGKGGKKPSSYSQKWNTPSAPTTQEPVTAPKMPASPPTPRQEKEGVPYNYEGLKAPSTSTVQEPVTIPNPPTSPSTTEQGRERVLNDYEDVFELDGKDYTMKVLFVDGGSDLLWLNTQGIEQNTFECKINAKHPFFNVFSDTKIDKSAIAILRAMAMAKFSAKVRGNDKVSEMFDYFNDYIRNIGV